MMATCSENFRSIQYTIREIWEKKVYYRKLLEDVVNCYMMCCTTTGSWLRGFGEQEWCDEVLEGCMEILEGVGKHHPRPSPTLKEGHIYPRQLAHGGWKIEVQNMGWYAST